MDTNRDSAQQSQNEDNFPTFSPGLEFLNGTEKEKNNGKRDSASAPSRFASLSEGEMQQILTERHSGKTKQMTNWFVSTFKSKLKFFRFEIAKYKTCAFSRKFEIKPVRFRIGFHAQFHRLCFKTIGSYSKLCIIKLWSTWEVWRALKKLELPLAITSAKSYACFMLSKLPTCSVTR